MQLKSAEDTLRVLEVGFPLYDELMEIVSDPYQVSEMVTTITEFFNTCEGDELNRLLHMCKKLSEGSYSWVTFPGDRFPLALKKFYGSLRILCKGDTEKVHAVYKFAEEHFITIFSKLCLFLLGDDISKGEQISAPTTLDIVQHYKEIDAFYDAMEKLRKAQSKYYAAASDAEKVGISPSALKKYQPEISTLLCSLQNYADSLK